jgi:drug/metabolite transporter (DMT)-like permease
MGLLLMVLATIFFASMHSMVRYAGGDMHPFVLVFFRNFFSLIVVIPLIIRAGRGALKSSHYSLLFLRGVVGITAMMAWFYGLVHVPITEATTLSFTAAIFTALSAIIFLGERVHFRRWAAIGCGFIGVLVVLRPDTGNFNPVMLMILFSAMFWALSITLIKHLSKTDSSTSLVAWMSIILTVLSFPFALYYWQWPVGEQWLWLMAIGVLGSLGHLCMVRALTLADITAVMSIDFFRLVWSALIGVYFFGDQMQLATWLGAAIIFASGLYIIFRESEVRAGQ